MKYKTILAALLLAAGTVLPGQANAADGNKALMPQEQPPYKYMQKGIKTRLEDLAAARDTRSATSDKTSGKTDARKPGKKSSEPVRASSSREYYAAVKTNIAHYAGAVANIGAEVQLHPHFSLDMPVNLSFWDMERAHGLRLVLFQPEARYWFRNAGSGHFIGVHAHVAGFNVQWNDWRYQSAGRPLFGGGISYGYSLRISEHWNFEFNIGAGYANMKYDRFYNIDNGAWAGNGVYEYWGITRLGLSLVYKF